MAKCSLSSRLEGLALSTSLGRPWASQGLNVVIQLKQTGGLPGRGGRMDSSGKARSWV